MLHFYLLSLISFSMRSRVSVAAVQHSNAQLSFPENCHFAAAFRDVQFGFVSIYIMAGSYPVLPLNISAISARRLLEVPTPALIGQI